MYEDRAPGTKLWRRNSRRIFNT